MHSVVDFLMYDENVPLPKEVGHDEWAGIYATVRVQFVEPRKESVIKRARLT